MSAAGSIETFLAMLAAERGAAVNTLAAYRRDLESAEEVLGDLSQADGPALASLGFGGMGGVVFLIAMLGGMVIAPAAKARLDRMTAAQRT